MSTCARRSAMAAVREVDEGHVQVESFVLSVDAEDQQLLAPLGQGFSAALAGARPTAAAVAPATAARRDTTMGMRNALAAARTARRTDRKIMLAKSEIGPAPLFSEWGTHAERAGPTPLWRKRRGSPGRLPIGEKELRYGYPVQYRQHLFCLCNGSLCIVVSS